jgi:UV excision repair protein RAD23
VTGTARNTAVDGLVEMGFSRDQVDRAMRAAFNNPDRAAEYLISGNIPETEAPAPPAAAPAAVPAAGAAAAAAPAAAASPARAAPSSSGAAADNLFAAAEAAMQQDDRSGAVGGGASQLESQLGGSLDSIVNSPQIQRIRAAVQENPALIGPLMQQIAAANPQLAALLQQDPQALYELLGVEEVDEGGLPPNVMHVNLTQEESAAVERLEQLGFDRQLVLQAFLICDKNEELAANFLFESTEEDEQMQ